MDAAVPSIKEIIELAEQSLFPIDYLPYGVFTIPGDPVRRIGVALGDYVVDLTWLEQQGWLKPGNIPLFQDGILNPLASQEPHIWLETRAQTQALLGDRARQPQCYARDAVQMHLPFAIPAFTDFYASEQHATNVGRLFRGGENALLPNWKRLPVAYNGRASTVFVSGTPIRRPMGQVKRPDQDDPIFIPTEKLDFELELGVFVGKGNPDGRPIPVDQAHGHLFGLVLLNDWSARDIQAFEYQPLGPFLGKSFATSISPWVAPMSVVIDAMVPIQPQVPPPVSYLYESAPQLPDIRLQVSIQPKGAESSTVICETEASQLYWSLAQMLAHHSVNGCIMQTGDLFGTGTISGHEPQSWGSLLELSFNGKAPLTLNDGISRTFLENGDTLRMSGYLQTAKGRFGLGEVVGTVIAHWEP